VAVGLLKLRAVLSAELSDDGVGVKLLVDPPLLKWEPPTGEFKVELELLPEDATPIFKLKLKGELSEEGVVGVATPLLGVFAPDEAADDDAFTESS
jgi:hypothetical protein